MYLKKNKVKTRKSRSFFFSNGKALKQFIFKALFIIISIAIFFLVIYKAYYYSRNPIDIEHIPLIKKNDRCIKRKFEQNDGLIFSNQDKLIYNSIKQKNEKIYDSHSKSENITQDFSHKQIFDIVQDIKRDNMSIDENENSKSEDQEILDKTKINKSQSQNKTNSSSHQMPGIKSIFELLN